MSRSLEPVVSIIIYIYIYLLLDNYMLIESEQISTISLRKQQRTRIEARKADHRRVHLQLQSVASEK